MSDQENSFENLLFGFKNICKKIIQGYNVFGVKHSPREMEEARNFVATLPIEDQAVYVDYICRNNINKQWFIDNVKRELKSVTLVNDAQNYSVTAIANLAYSYLNCDDEEVRMLSKNILDQVKDYFEQFNKYR